MNEIITERMPLGDMDASRADELAKQLDRKPSEIEFVRKGFIAESKGTDEEERSSTELINTADIDRDNEILMPKGADLSHFKKNPQVLWAHDYHQPPIGRAAWVKRDTASKGLLAKTIYATTDFAEDIWKLVSGKFLPARSVGFIPMEWHEPDEKEIARHPERAGARRVYDKWELLEYSVVPVPSNRQALQVAIGKGLGLNPGLQKQLGVFTISRDDLMGDNPAEALADLAASLGLDLDDTVAGIEALKEIEVVALPSLVKSVVYVPQVRRVVSLPKKVLDIRRKVVMVVADELDRLRGRI